MSTFSPTEIVTVRPTTTVMTCQQSHEMIPTNKKAPCRMIPRQSLDEHDRSRWFTFGP